MFRARRFRKRSRGSRGRRVYRSYRRLGRKRLFKKRSLPVDDARKRRIIKLRYSTQVPVAAGSLPGEMTPLKTFRANSIFDPDYTGIGTTVDDYTRWASLYNHYTVLGSKITYTISVSTSDINHLVFLTKVDDDGTGFASVQQYYKWSSDPNVKMKAFNLTSYTSQAQFKFTRKFSARKFFDVKNPADSDSCTAAFGANPSEQAFFCAAVQNTDLSTTTVPFTMIVEIDYIVQMGEQKDRYSIY